MSGLTRPSIVGPCELYGSSCLDCQHKAPTAKAAGDDAGAAMLPAATWYSSGGLQLSRSSRGEVETRYPRIAQNTVRSAPLDCSTHSSSYGDSVPVCSPSELARSTFAPESNSPRSKSDTPAGHSSHFRNPQMTSPFGQTNVLPRSPFGLQACRLPVGLKVPDQCVWASFPAELTQTIPCARAAATIAPTGPLPALACPAADVRAHRDKLGGRCTSTLALKNLSRLCAW